MTGDAYLKASLAPLVVQISSGEADFEVDAALLSEEDDLEVNIDNLCKAVKARLSFSYKSTCFSSTIVQILTPTTPSSYPPAS